MVFYLIIVYGFIKLIFIALNNRFRTESDKAGCIVGCIIKLYI